MNTMKTMTTALVLAAGLALTGCTAQAPAPAETTPVTETVAPTATETPAPEVTDPVAVEPAPEVVADEFSQVVDGVVFQGTEIAPVRIGTDIPGQSPAVEAQLERGTSEALAPGLWTWSGRLGGR